MSNVLNHYRYLHTIPEPGLEEFKTSDYVAGKLQEAGYKVTRNLAGTTGLVAEYDSGVPGPVLGIRADMDALTHIINGKKEFRHTCGHDSHSSMLLAVCEKVMAEKTIKKGRFKALFQPAEELGIGARKIVESNVLEDVDYLFGMHIRPLQECPAGGAICEMRYSAGCQFRARIKGRQSHGARPHLGINPIDASTCAIAAVNAIHMDPRIPFSVKCTRFHADSGVFNSVPEFADITFDMRSQDNQTMKEMREKTIKAIENGAAAVGAKVEEFEFYTDFPAAEGFDPEFRIIVQESVAEVVGKENIIPSFNTSGGEDFFVYPVKIPHLKVGFVGLGVGAEPGLHHQDMHFDTKYLENGVRIHETVIKKILG
ncbi:MAG: amidohydrolase [Acidaminococcaceae bacterium]|nr:amidohydrolase [Acidaminococcaceae bacterium]